MENKLSQQEKKTIISQFLNISFFGDINPPEFKQLNEVDVKEFSDSFKSNLLYKTEDHKPFIMSSISYYISNLDETSRKKLYLMMISTGNFTADAFLFNENNASIEEIHIGIIEAIEKNQNNLFVNLFFARILTIKGGIIAHKKHYATKEWYESAIENQLNDYNELCFIN
ncbi:MAG: hypothetical protein KIG88_04470 [Weeksellaceae bacterium]|nr:hypothetical protein [Weeksellaceae bacterium]